MSRHSSAWKLAVGTTALVVGLTACTSSKHTDTGAGAGAGSTSMSMSMPASPGSATDASASAASGLRAALTQLFRGHVNLTGYVVQTAVNTGIGSANTTQALAALDDNTVAIGKAIGSLYGDSAQTAFLSMWRAHIGFFVNYTKGLATHDTALVTEAQGQLAGYQKDFGNFLGTATGLPGAAVSADLQGHIQTLEAAIQAIVSKDPSAAAKLEMAAMHMDGTAQVLAGAIAKQKSLDGASDGTASGLRSALTGLLIQHVAQTVAVVQTAVGSSLTSPQTTAAVAALDQNTVDLGNAIGSLYGDAAKTAFLSMWRAHIGFFVNYTKGLATHDSALVTQAQGELAGYQKDFGNFLGSATGLPGAAVSADLQGHIQTLEAAIQAIVSGDPSAAGKVAMAEDHMSGTAAVLATAISTQKHLS